MWWGRMIKEHEKDRLTGTGQTVLSLFKLGSAYKASHSKALLLHSINLQDLGCLLFEKLLLSAAVGAKITPGGD